MKWVLAWFEYQQREWKRRAVWAEMQNLHGHKCYAEKQVKMWERMHCSATASFSKQ